MKKTILAVCLLSLVAFTGYAQAGGRGLPLPIAIEGTVWSGTVQSIAPGGTGASAPVDVTVTIDTQDGNFFTGTMTDLGNPEATVNFSGVIGPVDTRLLHITAVDQVIKADVVRAGRANKLALRGGNTATGVTFMGVLQRQ